MLDFMVGPHLLELMFVCPNSFFVFAVSCIINMLLALLHDPSMMYVHASANWYVFPSGMNMK